MRKTGDGSLSENFANFREFSGRRILTADDTDFRRWDKQRKNRIITRQNHGAGKEAGVGILNRGLRGFSRMERRQKYHRKVTNAEQTQGENRAGA